MRIEISRAKNGWICREPQCVPAEIRHRATAEDAHVFETWDSLIEWLYQQFHKTEEPAKAFTS